MATMSMAEVRWRARRDPGGGPPLLTLAFLGESDRRAVAAAAAVRDYLTSLTGRRRAEYDTDVVTAIAGERRLGQGLAAACFDFFSWSSASLAMALGEERAAILAAAGITDPSALRLRLFDLANRDYQGWVPAAGRAGALSSLAVALGLAAADGPLLESALRLDAEAEAVLTGADPPPTTEAILARYNRAALAAVLRQSRRVIVTLHAPRGGVIRRLYTWCRRLGVYADIEQPAPDADLVQLTLAGPEALSAPPASAGARLALVTLRLLRALGERGQAVAQLSINERPYQFVLGGALATIPGLVLTTADQDAELATYDSQVEAVLAERFAALARQQRSAGWRLLREPAPLLAGRRVLIPDFALERGGVRVYLEIAGFWTPGYLAKKRAGLVQLPPDTSLIIAVPEASLPAFAGLPFPLVPYREQVAPQTVLDAAARFDDVAARTAGGSERLQAACASSLGWLEQAEVTRLLGCFTAGETARALAATPPPAGWTVVPGAGLCSAALRGRLEAALTAHWQQTGAAAHLTLEGVRMLGVAPLPREDESLLALLDTLAGCRLTHDSLFDVTVVPSGAALPITVSAPAAPPAPPAAPRPRRQRQPPAAPALFLED